MTDITKETFSQLKKSIKDEFFSESKMPSKNEKRTNACMYKFNEIISELLMRILYS